MGLRIALVSRDNGVGLSLDVRLLTELFTSAGHEAVFRDWQEPSMPRADVALHLELVSRNLATYADRNILVPNLEWYPSEWLKYLPAFDQIWAKSQYAFRFCRNRGAKDVRYTGFLGLDLYDPDVKRELECVHLRGRSALKGTDRVIEAWRREPTLPHLTVISHESLRLPQGTEDRISVVLTPSDAERDRLLNRAEIHVCPSVAEGWGHYITEAMSVGAVVVTTDASPMNEHIRPEWGYLTGVASTREHHAAILTYTDPALIGQAVHRARSLPALRRHALGQDARRFFLERNAAFRETALKLVER